MQELATSGGRLLDRDMLSNSGEWSGIASSFAAMKRLSGGHNKENKLRFSKRSSLGDYQTLLWSLFDAGMLYRTLQLIFCASL
jgi:Rab3 GTPase-activating protein catalytic subunit